MELFTRIASSHVKDHIRKRLIDSERFEEEDEQLAAVTAEDMEDDTLRLTGR